MNNQCGSMKTGKKNFADILVKIVAVIICSICFYMIQLEILPNTDEMANFARFNMIHNGRMSYQLGNIIWDICSEISYLIFGYSYTAVRFNNTLLYSIIILLSLNIICYYRKNMNFLSKWSFLPFYIYMVAVLANGHSVYYGVLGEGIYIYPLNNHFTPIIFTLIYVNFILYAEKNKMTAWKKYVVQICILMYGCIWTDSIFVIICVFPCLVYYGVLFFNKKKNVKLFYKLLYAFVIMLILINILACFFPQLSFLHRDKMEQYRDVVYGISNFGKLENLGIRIITYLYGCFGLFNCLFWGNSILNINNFTYLIRFLILILCVIVIFMLIRKWIKLKHDNILVILGLGELFLSLAFLLADFGEMYINQRYLGAILYFSIIIIICEKSEFSFINGVINEKKCWLSVAFILLIFLRLDSFCGTPNLKYEKQLEQLAQIINENKLGSGFSPYWISFNISSKLNENYAVDPVDYSSGSFTKSINTGLPNQADKYNYIIVAKSGDDYLYSSEINEKSLKKMYGNYTKYETEDFALYYFKNVINLCSGYIDKDVDTMHLGENTKISNGKFLLKKSGYIYGPYVDLDSGVYQVEISGKNLENALIKITGENGAEDINIEYCENNGSRIIVKFGLKEYMDNVEFVIRNNSASSIIINNIYYTRSNENVQKYLAKQRYDIKTLSNYIYKSAVKKDCIMVSTGGYIYGPYAEVEKGSYKVNIYGKNLDLATFAIQYNLGENKIEYSILDINNNKACLLFKTDKKIDDLEIVTSNMAEKEIGINMLEIIKQND